MFNLTHFIMANVTIKVVGTTGKLHKFVQVADKCYEFIAVNAQNKAFIRKDIDAARFNAAKQYLLSLQPA
jgi:hypothetical protein